MPTRSHSHWWISSVIINAMLIRFIKHIDTAQGLVTPAFHFYLLEGVKLFFGPLLIINHLTLIKSFQPPIFCRSGKGRRGNSLRRDPETSLSPPFLALPAGRRGFHGPTQRSNIPCVSWVQPSSPSDRSCPKHLPWKASGRHLAGVKNGCANQPHCLIAVTSSSESTAG